MHSLSHLAYKHPHFINVMQNMVINNIFITVWGSIIMKYILFMRSFEQNIQILQNFCNHAYFKHVFQYAISHYQTANQQLLEAVVKKAEVQVSNDSMPSAALVIGLPRVHVLS